MCRLHNPKSQFIVMFLLKCFICLKTSYKKNYKLRYFLGSSISCHVESIYSAFIKFLVIVEGYKFHCSINTDSIQNLKYYDVNY